MRFHVIYHRSVKNIFKSKMSSRHCLSSLSHSVHRPITKDYIKRLNPLKKKERECKWRDLTHACREIVLVDSTVNKNGRDTFRMYVISGEPLPYL